jgi:hypothetical protein
LFHSFIWRFVAACAEAFTHEFLTLSPYIAFPGKQTPKTRNRNADTWQHPCDAFIMKVSKKTKNSNSRLEKYYY